MARFNKVILLGRLVADPELRQTPNNTSVTSFTVAVDRKHTAGEEKQADFLSVIAWRQTAEFICRHFTKGSAILIEGELQTRSWTDKQGAKRYATDVVANEVFFAESKKSAVSEAEHPNPYFQAATSAAQFEEVAADEALPF